MRLIDADALKNEFPKDSDWNCPVHTNSHVCELIDAMPTIEPEQRSAQPERKKGEWIPVSERLPDKDGDYLVTFQLLWLKPIEVCHFENGVWDKGAYERVLAWMPLPECYRGES